MKTLFLIPLIVMLLGCRTDGSRANGPMDVENATRLAQRLANQKAQTLYHCQPFKAAPLARLVHGHWEWCAWKAQGQLDLQASVSFARDGSAPSVEILLLDNRTVIF